MENDERLFYQHQPDLNINNPDVRAEIHRIVGFWLELGLSGFRVDAVPFLIEQEGGRAVFARCDVADGQQVVAAADAALEAFGRLDVAVANAGINPAIIISAPTWL